MPKVEKTGKGAGQSVVQVVRAGPDHDAAVAEFFRATWDPQATAESLRRSRLSAAAENPVSPGEEAPSFIFLQDGNVLGYVGTIPIGVWTGKDHRAAHWVKGLMVLPEFRNGPVGFLVLKEAARNLDCSMALAVLPVVVGLFERLGFSDLGMLSNFVRVLRPSRLLRRLRLDEVGFSVASPWLLRAATFAQRTGLASGAGLCAGGMTRLWIAARGGFSRFLSIETAMPEPAEMDALWLRTRDTLSASLVRDSRYLNWRYPPHESRNYQFVAIRDGRDVAALAVVRRPRAEGDPRLHGIAVATVSEWIFPLDRPMAGLAALAGAEQVARAFGADALLCSACHPVALSLLPRRGYWKAPGNVHLIVRDSAKLAPPVPLPRRLSDWWITRGDSNADEVF